MSATVPKRGDLAGELLAMAEEEVHLRMVAASGAEADLAAMREADARHLVRFREIVAEVGWPGEELVGRDGAEAAWLIAQHADDPEAAEFRRQCLELLRRSVQDGHADVWHFALLADRVAVAEGLFRHQRPGIQPYGHLQGSVGLPDGTLAPVLSSDQVEANRQALGLVPLAQLLADTEGRAGILIPYLGARPEGSDYAWRSGVSLPETDSFLEP